MSKFKIVFLFLFTVLISFTQAKYHNISSNILGEDRENIDESKKAMKTFQVGYILEEIGGITKDLMLEKAEAIKRDFGY